MFGKNRIFKKAWKTVQLNGPDDFFEIRDSKGKVLLHVSNTTSYFVLQDTGPDNFELRDQDGAPIVRWDHKGNRQEKGKVSKI